MEVEGTPMVSSVLGPEVNEHQIERGWKAAHTGSFLGSLVSADFGDICCDEGLVEGLRIADIRNELRLQRREGVDGF